MKGIILAGGNSTQLHPATVPISKQLLPIYDKPMIYYPLSVLMSSKIRDILIITTPQDQSHFQTLLKDGSQWGIKISYEIQQHPNGIADAFIIGEKFIGNDNVVLILGDNIFWGSYLTTKLSNATFREKGATIFAYPVNNPERYSVVEIDKSYIPHIRSLEEKPSTPKSNYAVTGLYCYDNHVIEYVNKLSLSEREQLEITDLNNIYLYLGDLHVEIMDETCLWLNTDTPESILQASQLVQTIQARHGTLIASPEIIAYKNKFINEFKLSQLANESDIDNVYSEYLLKAINIPV